MSAFSLASRTESVKSESFCAKSFGKTDILLFLQLRIERKDNGFGFTLRHFIVYPPEVKKTLKVKRKNLQIKKKPPEVLKKTEVKNHLEVKRIPREVKTF